MRCRLKSVEALPRALGATQPQLAWEMLFLHNPVYECEGTHQSRYRQRKQLEKQMDTDTERYSAPAIRTKSPLTCKRSERQHIKKQNLMLCEKHICACDILLWGEGGGGRVSTF